MPSNEGPSALSVGGHGPDVQTTSGPAPNKAPDEAIAETVSKAVARSSPSRGITGYQSGPPPLNADNQPEKADSMGDRKFILDGKEAKTVDLITWRL